MLNPYLPLSSVPWQPLSKNRDSVALEQWRVWDRLFVATPIE